MRGLSPTGSWVLKFHTYILGEYTIDIGKDGLDKNYIIKLIAINPNK